jgi:hypothetical protein
MLVMPALDYMSVKFSTTNLSAPTGAIPVTAVKNISLLHHSLDNLLACEARLPDHRSICRRQVAAKAGFPTKSMFCNDIMLFSSIIGNYLADKKIADLGTQIVNPKIEFLKPKIDEDGITGAGAALLAMKIAQLGQKEALYYQSAKKELIVNWPKYHNDYMEKLARMKAVLHGMNYDAQDGRIALKQYAEDEKALIYYNPPGFKNGYEKMFDIANYMTWNEPLVLQITPEESELILDDLLNAKATVVVNTSMEEIPDGWAKMYAGEVGSHVNYVLCNNHDLAKDFRFVDKKFAAVIKAPYPLYDDSFEITKDTKVQLVKLRREVGEHYRDLFAHRLGATSADVVVGFLINGMLMSVAGPNIARLFGIGALTAEAKKNYIHEIYGMTVPSKRYKRIRMLFMTFLASKQFRDDFVKIQDSGCPPP